MNNIILNKADQHQIAEKIDLFLIDKNKCFFLYRDGNEHIKLYFENDDVILEYVAGSPRIKYSGKFIDKSKENIIKTLNYFVKGWKKSDFQKIKWINKEVLDKDYYFCKKVSISSLIALIIFLPLFAFDIFNLHISIVFITIGILAIGMVSDAPFEWEDDSFHMRLRVLSILFAGIVFLFFGLIKFFLYYL